MTRFPVTHKSKPYKIKLYISLVAISGNHLYLIFNFHFFRSVFIGLFVQRINADGFLIFFFQILDPDMNFFYSDLVNNNLTANKEILMCVYCDKIGTIIENKTTQSNIVFKIMLLFLLIIQKNT